MMRVAHLIDDGGLGGVNRWLDALLPRLSGEFHHDRHLVAPGRQTPPKLRADVIVIHFTLSWRKLPWVYRLRWRNPAASLILVEHSYTRAFEALHVGNRRRFRAMLGMACRVADQVVAVSAAQGEWLCEAAGVPRDKLAVINPITDLDALRILKLPERATGPLRLCGYGRYSPQKGLDTLVAAMRLVPQHVTTLRLVGLGPDEAALRDQSADLPHVIVEGHTAGPVNLFRQVDALAIPSRFEAFGCVAAEARAAGRPIIVSNVDGLPGQALPPPQLCVAPDNPAALARAIMWLAEQDLARLGAAARQSIDGAEELACDAWRHLLHKAGAAGNRRDNATNAVPRGATSRGGAWRLANRPNMVSQNGMDGIPVLQRLPVLTGPFRTEASVAARYLVEKSGP
jgi:glycosyltransferase involved in cell wall biosynthesis